MMLKKMIKVVAVKIYKYINLIKKQIKKCSSYTRFSTALKKREREQQCSSCNVYSHLHRLKLNHLQH